tara:strand:- start:5318 stop:5695 length:378 start_codon:yes stop_codon:yes gene_type:complete
MHEHQITTVDILKDQLNKRRKNFLVWLKKNPEVWTEFVNLSFQAINAGRKQYSAWLIVAHIRVSREIKSSDGTFKISNERTGWLARLFHHQYPEYQNFYKTRPMKEERLIEEYLSKPNNVIQLYQ